MAVKTITGTGIAVINNIFLVLKCSNDTTISGNVISVACRDQK
jgi:hypothetical protein